jgi:hypothetical protein
MESVTSIREKLELKERTLQFLPVKMQYLVDCKTILHNNKKIKTAYLVDIIHGLILKYYFKKDNKFSLHSSILKEKYGHLYNHYISWLVDNRLIEMRSNYLAGRNSRSYSICSEVLKGKILRYSNRDKTLLRKYKNSVSRVEDGDIGSDLIHADVKAKLVDDLFHVEIDQSAAIFYLDNLKDFDGDIYNRNVYSVECIGDKHIFYHFDNYGRMHTNFTILKSFIRKTCLLIDGEPTHEIDIKNSQPLFLTKVIESSGTKWVKQDEFELFKYLTINGIYYQYVMDATGNNDRSVVKEMTYRVLFGKNAHSCKADKVFSSLFPTIHNFIKLYKKEKGDYRVLAYELQKAESSLLFNRIVKNVMQQMPDVKMVTVHDSIIVPFRHRDSIEAIFNLRLYEEFGIIKKASENINI